MPQSPIQSLVYGKTPGGAVAPLKVDGSGNLLVSGPGGGEAVSIADGADVAQGALADTAWVSGNGSIISILKGIFGRLAAPLSTSAIGSSAYNTAANQAGHQVKSGAGVFDRFNVNTVGVTSAAVLYDGTSTAGVKLATIDTTALVSGGYGIAFTTGLFVVLTGGTPADVTVSYR